MHLESVTLLRCRGAERKGPVAAAWPRESPCCLGLGAGGVVTGARPGCDSRVELMDWGRRKPRKTRHGGFDVRGWIKDVAYADAQELAFCAGRDVKPSKGILFYGKSKKLPMWQTGFPPNLQPET